MTMGRPPKGERKSIGAVKCPICGKEVEVWEGWRGTAYSNHDGHGFKMSKKQVDDFIKEHSAPEQVTPPAQAEEEPELQKDGFSIFSMEF